MIRKLSAACYAVRLSVHISSSNTQINLLYIRLFCYKIWNNFLWFHITKENHQNYAWSTWCTVQNPQQKSAFKLVQFLSVPCQYTVSIRNFIINNQEIFQSYSCMHHINARNKHHLHRQMPTYLVFKKVHFMLASTFYHPM